MAHSTHEPGAWLASSTKRAEGSATSTSPPARISNTPTSLVAPKRFFSARRVRKLRSRSPSNSSTQSTRCSSVRGPATVPSFVTCPTRTTAVPSHLATPMIAAAASRTWPTDPGAPVIPSTWSVWIESTTQTSGRSCLERGQHGLDRGLGENRHRQRLVAQPLGAHPDLGGRFLPGDVEDPPPGRAEVAERHPGERALADSRRATDQDQRAGHKPATEHPVELGDPGQQASGGRRLDVAEGDGAGRLAGAGRSSDRPLAASATGAPTPRLRAAASRTACSTRRTRDSDRSRPAPRGRIAGRRSENPDASPL